MTCTVGDLRRRSLEMLLGGKGLGGAWFEDEMNKSASGVASEASEAHGIVHTTSMVGARVDVSALA